MAFSATATASPCPVVGNKRLRTPSGVLGHPGVPNGPLPVKTKRARGPDRTGLHTSEWAIQPNGATCSAQYVEGFNTLQILECRDHHLSGEGSAVAAPTVSQSPAELMNEATALWAQLSNPPVPPPKRCQAFYATGKKRGQKCQAAATGRTKMWGQCCGIHGQGGLQKGTLEYREQARQRAKKSREASKKKKAAKKKKEAAAEAARAAQDEAGGRDPGVAVVLIDPGLVFPAEAARAAQDEAGGRDPGVAVVLIDPGLVFPGDEHGADIDSFLSGEDTLDSHGLVAETCGEGGPFFAL